MIMATKKVNAIIERASDGGYGVYCPDITDAVVYGYGHTEEEAKKELRDNFEVSIEHFK
jgi:predicted RNase H-like HicB family nuclease